MATSREVKVIKTKPPPLLIREQDIYEETTDHVLAQCYYCHYEYVPVPANEYSPCVVYNCGCHKEPYLSTETMVGLAVILVGIVLCFIIGLSPLYMR